MWTCEHKFAMSGQTDSQVDARSTQVARKLFQCSLALAPVQRKTILRPTCDDLRRVAKRLKTCFHLRANLSLIKVNASICKAWPNGVFLIVFNFLFIYTRKNHQYKYAKKTIIKNILILYATKIDWFTWLPCGSLKKKSKLSLSFWKPPGSYYILLEPVAS